MTDDYPNIQLRVAGIFKGGGAKGLVYAGALHELRARGIWFDTVAGSSAGAITATLVACRFSPDDIATAASEALETIPWNWRGFLPWGSRSVFRTSKLESWLEGRLRTIVGPTEAGRSITFRDLAGFSDIELNVVAMDLDRRQPIVFRPRRIAQ
jgi:predicted acylesterase/phospholipase RssA